MNARQSRLRTFFCAFLGPGMVLASVLAAAVARADIEVSSNFADIGQRGVASASANHSNPGSVTKMLFHDGKLILGGSYNKVGTFTTSLAAWDGSTWSTYDDGTRGAGREMAFHHDKLVLGAYIWDPGWRYLLGTTHTQMGLECIEGNMPGLVGQNWGLAGAGLALPETYPLPYHVMRWSGFEWIELGTYGEAPYDNDAVLAMTELDGDLVVGGDLHEMEGVPVSGVARWDGASWSAMGSALSDAVYQFSTFQGDLYAANRWGLVHWNGTDWDTVAGSEGRWIESLAIHGNELVVGGDFAAIGGASSRNVALWDGATWSALADLGGRYEDVLALASDGANLYAGGNFTVTEGLPISGLARWTGSSWENMGGPGLGLNTSALERSVTSFTPFDGGLVAAGAFSNWGSVTLNGVGLLRTDRWEPLGQGFDDLVTSVAVYDGELYAGGYFLASGSTPLSKVARWDGAAWQPVAGNIDAKVEAMTVYDGHLVIGGNFTQIDGVPFSFLARWNGTSWSDVGGGRPGKVYGFTQMDGDLYAAIDEGGLRYVDRFDGTSWTTLAGRFDAEVYTVAAHDGRLYAGGLFTHSEAGLRRHVAQWDGQAWQSMDQGTDGVVLALASHGDRLFVTGHFGQAGGQTANNLAAWSTNGPGHWEDLGLGLNWDGSALYSAPEGLYIGGDFVQVSTPSGIVESFHVARLDTPAAVAVPEGPPTRLTAIENVFPNPTNPRTTIAYQLQRSSSVELGIYDARGRLVRRLALGTLAAGRHTAIWDGDDQRGQPVGSGVYYVRLNADGAAYSRKVAVAR